jgi:two-component system cell cycle sensor histidine kinase/response regulator CckA
MNSPPKILVVDDEPRLCDSMKILLSSEGYYVQTAKNGAEGIACLKNNGFDLALLDIGLPDMDGYQVVDKIMEHDPDIIIIMLTGNACLETAIQAVKKGVYDFLRKPVEPEVLLKTAKKALEQQQLQTNLKESEFRFRQLAEATWEGIAIHDHGILHHANHQFYDMFGYRPEDLIKKQIYTHLIVPNSLRPLKTHQASYEINTYEAKGIKKNGTQFPIEIRTKQIIFYGQSATVASVRDITERKQAEEEHLILQKKLAKANTMEALGLMAGSVAHDLNNILSGIISYPELILMDLPPDSKLAKPLKTIKNSGERAAAVVSDLMSIARISTTEKIPYNLNPIINEYLHSPECHELKTRYPEITIQTNIEPDLMNIYCSPIHINKVLMNLVQNAAESMGKNGTITISTKTITISTKNFNTEGSVIDKYLSGDLVTLSVVDDGPGINKKDMDRIFEPFYTKKIMGRSGTGLGLSVVWNTLKDHKGHIEVSSDSGQTRFELFFQATRDKTYQNKEEVLIENYTGSGESILVVDDQKNQREIASELLTRLGYKVNTVTSGEEAIQYLDNHTADVILLDMIMDPGINGLETYKRIKKKHPGQKAIIASGYSESEHVKDTQKLGAGQYIKKPYTLAGIGLAIRDEIKKMPQEIN